jgi:hypothetical protein
LVVQHDDYLAMSFESGDWVDYDFFQVPTFLLGALR